ncbi:hypothetical protein ABD91_00405 [Lysinibacillus sphaericus]|uniref:hypothetical protein n=1 Tax=Lysinibacillus sphaericus TaxID=1421 RepID=UPI0018CD1ED6|nr:hypothetical protein [Lysinibacillus sphaericus]MBG9689393.1 hypothetical protein [Lysinibacillus sphaericus]
MVKIMKSDWQLVREAESNGLCVSMNSIVERNRTELNKELSSYFKEKLPNIKSYYDVDQGEDVMDSINSYMEDNSINKHLLHYPYSEGTDIYLIPITENLSLKVDVFDEYHGQGESNTGVHIDRFVITEEATSEDVDKLIEMFNEYGIK